MKRRSKFLVSAAVAGLLAFSPAAFALAPAELLAKYTDLGYVIAEIERSYYGAYYAIEGTLNGVRVEFYVDANTGEVVAEAAAEVAEEAAEAAAEAAEEAAEAAEEAAEAAAEAAEEAAEAAAEAAEKAAGSSS